MDALIRSALVAPFRMRLSEVPGSRPDARAGSAQGGDLTATTNTLRADVEKQVRAELTAQLESVSQGERERARAEGYTEGLAQARSSAEKERAEALQQLRDRAERALSAIEQAHSSALASFQSTIGEIAFAAVCRLVGEKAASQAFVAGLVELTCAQLRTESVATARLHPRDIEMLGELLQEGALRIQAINLAVAPDESLELGGCIIETTAGRYDGALDSQLRRLHAVLTA